jgi:predicted RNA-binding protein YlqC (UPF0109 family)
MSKELIEKMAMAIVNSPDQVQVTETKTDRFTVVELNVAKEDVGQVVGKKGRTAQAMRTLLQATTAKSGRRASLEIMDK